MTRKNLWERLTHFRNQVVRYRALVSQDHCSTHDEREPMVSADIEASRDKLRQEYDQLADAIAALSQGPYRLDMVTGQLLDVYRLAFSAHGDSWHLDFVIHDLGTMVTTLESQPPESVLHSAPVCLYMQSGILKRERAAKTLPQQEVGHNPVLPSPTIKDVLIRLTHFFHQQIPNADDRASVQEHLQAILRHPALRSLHSTPIADVLSCP
ncbi:MAG: hypothetical protein D6690_00330 [Nitrospirae bacterium]|nr:MAG: hypothetical protein D6690_00330 [Nitrospirota bacterium]